MAEKFPFPYPCEYIPIFNSQHDVAVLIEEYKQSGHIKRCTYVSIKDILDGYTGAVTYRPDCEKDSFVVKKKNYRQYDFYGCPKDCRLYQAVWWGKPKQWLKDQWWPFRRFIVGTAQWYASLSPVTQVIIAITLLALAGTPWRGTIVDVLKIIYQPK